MMLELILAASLSSSYLDDFFTLPNWMPTSVDSEDTPGSDPPSGGGWYVEEYTNAVSFTDWTVNANGQEVNVGYVLAFGGGEWHNIDSAGSLAYGIIYGSEHEVYDVYTDPGEILGTGEELELEWIADVIHQADNPQGFDHTYLNMRATREIVLTPVPTGKWKPRAARLTPDIQAGVLSSFAGYFERQYYAGQGQTNDWNTSIWGPTLNKKKFWFDPLSNGCEFVFHPTNRTIRTRRLVNYDNIKNLADFMTGNIGINEFMHIAPHRPGWIYGIENGESSNGCTMWWSTTDSSVLIGTRIVPEFSSISNPTMLSGGRQWGTCSQPFSVLVGDDVWIPWDASSRRFFYPSYKMMAALSYGQDPSYYDASYCAPDLLLTKTFQDVLTNAYPHTDPVGITNETHRLVSDRLCNINQALGLMDRTYHVPEVIYPTEGTNWNNRNSLIYFGYANPASMSQSGAGMPITVTFGQNPFSWDPPIQTNRVYENDRTYPGNEIRYRVSGTRTETDIVLNSGLESIRASDEIVRMALNGFTDGPFDIAFWYRDDFSLQDGVVSVQIYWTDWITYEHEGSVYVSVVLTNFPSYFTYSREYDHENPAYHYATLGVTQPGWQSRGRVSACKYGRVSGIHYRNVAPVGAIEWNRASSTTLYDSHESSYGSRVGLLSDIRSLQDALSVRFANLYGISPSNWEQIIPIDVTDAESVRDSIDVTSCTVSYVKTRWMTEVIGHILNGNPEIETVVSYDYGTYEEEEGYHALATSSLSFTHTKDSPSQVERQPLAMDAKIGVITRTDWNWKTLKRSE